MITGLIILVFTGLFWVGIGSVVSSAAQKNLNMAFIQGGSAAILMLLTLPAYFFCEITIPAISVISLLLAGAGNSGTFLLMSRAMKYGPNGLTWAMIQSAFVIPFLMGIIFFDVPSSVWRTMGLIILALATVGMGVYGKQEQSNSEEKNKSKWIIFCILAYIAAGLTQCCGNLPSYFVNEGAVDFGGLIFRTGLSCIGIVCVSVIQIVCAKDYGFGRKGTIPQIIVMCISSFVGTIALYFAMDMMVQHQAGAISYPVVTGVSIAAFVVYTAISLKEKMKIPAVACIILTLAGIVLVAL